jgi:hypothetical protein
VLDGWQLRTIAQCEGDAPDCSALLTQSSYLVDFEDARAFGESAGFRRDCDDGVEVTMWSGLFCEVHILGLPRGGAGIDGEVALWAERLRLTPKSGH